MRIVIDVIGLPKGQPRARACRRGTHAGVYDPGTSDGWKALIAAAVRPHIPAAPLEGPLAVDVTWIMPRPKAHFRTGSKAGVLRPEAPTLVTAKPDRDNLDKAVLDALTQCRMWTDDAQVVAGRLLKRYGEPPGCRIVIETEPAVDDYEARDWRF
jgi:Holliday junction resolvase RusA-like endonuclease